MRFNAYFRVLCHNDPPRSGAIVNTPYAQLATPCVHNYDDILNSRPPNGVLTLVNSLSTKRHRTLHYADTDEEMVSQIRWFVCGETRASLILRSVPTLR